MHFEMWIMKLHELMAKNLSCGKRYLGIIILIHLAGLLYRNKLALSDIRSSLPRDVAFWPYRC